MSLDALFQIANSMALLGWLALALGPLAPRAMGLVGGVAVPLVLSGGYAAIVLSHWSSGQGGFDSLASVEQLFKSRWLLLAGWVHYLAFDLLVGAWQLRTARREGIAHLMLLPCLLAVFSGYLALGMALPVVPRHVHETLGQGPVVVGVVMGAQFVSSFFARMWAGETSDARGPRRALRMGLLLATSLPGLHLF